MKQKQFGSRPVARKRVLSLLLAAVMVLGFFPGLGASGSGASAHWADPYLSQLAEWGFIRQNQMNNPDRALTRADFMSIVNKAYGYHELGETPFEDVLPSDWFFDDVGIAYTAKYIVGTSPTTASPNNPLTRETAATILGRNMMLEESPGALVEFSDSNKISTWAMGTIKSSLEHYLINGYSDGSFRPQRNVSWGEMASMITNLIGTPLQEPGDYSLGGVFGNVTITSPNVTLRDTVISGDLYISGGVGLGGIKLENVTVLGRIVACGTGNSETGEASILLRNVTADEMLIDNLQDNFVSVQADGITQIGRTTVRTSAYIEDNTPEGMGLQYISLEGDSYPEGEEPEDWEPPLFQLAGRIKEVVNRTPNSTVQVGRGTVEKLTVDEAAANSNVVIDRGAVVKELALDATTIVTGQGDIEHLIVNAPGCEVEMLPDKITIRPGITAIINGEEMDTVAAEEASEDPMILAGYPEAQDVVPTGLDAAFMTNKAGTVYWAVSSVNDGSIGEDDLIKPPSYGSMAVANGSLAVANGNEEVIAKVTGLAPGGDYYLSAVLVDNRGNHSTVKVISFTTPDNTIPAFCEGYPYMSKVSCADSVAVVMPNKDCKMYYALLPAGAVAPTENELRSGAVSGALGYGVMDVTKNKELTFRVNDVRLEEQTQYVLYLWLTDADGVNKGQVVSLPFTTADETPPEFVVDPTPNKIQATSVGLNFQLDEDGTVYWVAVPSGTVYPKPEPGTDYETAPPNSMYGKLQIEHGMNLGADGKSGSVNAKALTDGTINVSGLKAETAYDFYYVAKDTAGNYSVIWKQTVINTLDNNGPKVTQSFSKVSGTDNTKDPMSTTDIFLDFSENVRYTGGEGGKSFLELYQDVKNSNQSDEAVNLLAANLAGAIQIHKINILDNSEIEVTNRENVSEPFSDNMTIDYTLATVEAKTDGTGGIQVKFPAEGLHLENGAEYYFTINKITDISNNQNPIVPDPVDFWSNKATSEANGHNVPPFIVEFATVNLSRTPTIGPGDGPYIREGGEVTGTLARLDYRFRMAPVSTSTVSNTISYDILLWTDSSIRYDVYYRVLSKTDGRMDEDGTYKTFGEGENAVEPKDYLIQKLGSKEAETPKGDENGWIYLGNSGENYPNGVGDWSGKSVNGRQFNGCTASNFPLLNTFNEDLRYDFVITVTEYQGTDPETWNGTVKMRVNVAAGLSGDLYDQSGAPNTLWDLRDTVGIRSIGRYNNLETNQLEETLELSKLFRDSKLPSFFSGMPTFDNITSTSVSMNLTLDNPGYIYYVIGKADSGKGTPEITTTRYVLKSDLDDAAADSTYKNEYLSGGNQMYVTLNGTNRPEDSGNVDTSQMHNWMKGNEEYTPKQLLDDDSVLNEVGDNSALSNQVLLPTSKDIYNRSGGLSRLPNGMVTYDGSTELPVTVDGLTPNTDYFAYFVIKGEDDALSHVYIYHFKTDLTSKPKINLNPANDGSSELWTDIPAKIAYRLYTRSEAWQIPSLKEPFSKYVDERYKELPSCWSVGTWKSPDDARPAELKDVFTVLDAMTTTYSNGSAAGSANAANAYIPHGPNGVTDISRYEGGYSVFDIYANNDIRGTIDEMIRTGAGGNPAKPIDDLDNVDSPGGGTSGKISVIDTSELEPATYYVLLTAGQSPIVNENESTEDSLRDSFKANQYIYQTAGAAPNLEEVSGLLITPDEAADGKYKIAGTLIFDKPLYEKIENDPNTNKRPLTGDTLKGMMAPPPEGDELEIQMVGNNLATEIFSFKGAGLTPGRSFTVASNTICNAAPTPAPEQLIIEVSVEQTRMEGTERVTYIEVTVKWGQKDKPTDDYYSRTVEYVISRVDTSAANNNNNNTVQASADPANRNMTLPESSTSPAKDNGVQPLSPSATLPGTTNMNTGLANNINKATAATPANAANSSTAKTLTVSPSSVNLDVGGTATLKASLSGVSWKSDNTSVATVSGGVVTAKGIGTASITATANGKTVTVPVTVKGKLTGMGLASSSGGASLSGSTLTMTRSAKAAPTATLDFKASGSLGSNAKVSVLSVKDSAGKDASKYLNITNSESNSLRLNVKLGTGTPGQKTDLTVTVGLKSTGGADLSPSGTRAFTVTVSGNDSNMTIAGKLS